MNHRIGWAEYFGDKGVLAKTKPEYIPREGQIQMACEVSRAIEMGGSLVVEAGTGVGKTLAYLLPSAGEFQACGARIAIVTANINLQHQILSKDVPWAASLMQVAQPAAIMKGIQNYFCEYEFKKTQNSLPMYRDKHTPDHLRAMQELWMSSPDPNLIREKMGLPFEPTREAWLWSSTDFESCEGPSCPSFSACDTEKARRAATFAPILITNYHLLFAELSKERGTGLFDTRTILICDEAHEIPEIAREFFGASLSLPGVKKLCKHIGRDQDLKKRVLNIAEGFFSDLAEAFYERGTKTRIHGRLQEVDASHFYTALMDVRSYFSSMESDGDSMGRRSFGKQYRETVSDFLMQLKNFFETPLTNHVNYVQIDGDRVSLESRPLHVAERLGRIWSRFHATIFTSATLRDSKGFSYIRREAGIPAQAKELEVSTPFYLPRQVALFIDSTMPLPTGDMRMFHALQAVDRFQQVIEENRGRVLGLFTSVASMQVVAEGLKKRWKDPPYPIYVQGTLSRQELLTRFSEETNSVLFGLSSFWSGVDVPGESLSCVVIEKLPFPAPDEPILEALSEQSRDGFQEVSLPKAVIEFRQGVGRLIRRVSDCGTIVVLDPRLLSASYRTAFLSGLKDVPYLTDLTRFREAVEFFDEQRTLSEAYEHFRASAIAHHARE